MNKLKLEQKLILLINDYFQQFESLNSSLFEKRNNSTISEKEKKQLIEYSKNEIYKTKWQIRIYKFLGIITAMSCLFIAYNFFEKIINNNLISYLISFCLFYTVNEIFVRKVWIMEKDKTNFEMLLETLKDIK